jgi:predicted dehydrogenase
MIRLAIGDLNEPMRRELSSRLRGAALVPSANDLPQACDAAVLFGPLSDDGAAVVGCLRAGKPVLLTAEALAASETLRSLAEVASQAGVPLVVANLDRYLPSRQLIRLQLDAGKLGEPGLIRLHRWETPVTETRGPDDLPVSLLCDLDLVLWYFGKSPDRVYAVAQAAMQVHLGFPGGGMALLDNTHRMPAGDGYHSLSLIGSAGAAYADDHQNVQILYRRGHPEAVLADEWKPAYFALMQDFVDVLSAGRDLSARFPAWGAVLAVAAAVRTSLRERRAVEPEGLQ